MFGESTIFELIQKVIGGFTRRPHVHLVRKPGGSDLAEAFELWDRIPESERWGWESSSDMESYITDSYQRKPTEEHPWEDFFYLYKDDKEVLGFLLGHYYPDKRTAYIEYLGTDPKAFLKAASMLSIAVGKHLRKRNCELAFIDVEPHGRARARQRIDRLNNLIWSSVQRSIKRVGVPFLLPALSLSTAEEGLEMWLILIPLKDTSWANRDHVSRDKYAVFLSWVYTTVFTQGYSDDPPEQQEYEDYMEDFCKECVQKLPDRIALETIIR